MGRSPCCSKEGLNRGAWTAQEDQMLSDYIKSHGEGKWRKIPKEAGLKRCGKSCRLRWLNYLRPDIKRGNITQEEEDLIVRLHKLLGNRWSLIAGRIPGRTDNEIKNYWNTTLGKKVMMNGTCTTTTTTNQPTTKSSSIAHEKRKKKKNKTKLLSTIVEPANVAVRTKAFRCNKVVVTPPVTVAPPLQIDQNRQIDKEATSSEDHAMSDFDIGEFLLSGINNNSGDDTSDIWKVWPSANAPLLFSEEMLKDWMRDDCFHQQS